jgi:glycosyltransferase involved in cell wall biosynthesis
MNKITFCIPSKNNLRYLKNSINSIKKNSGVEHDIIVYVDSDNDGTEQWLIENKIQYLINESKIPKGIAYAYNRCIESAKTEIVCMFHADMYMAKHFDINSIKHLKPKTVIAGTRIEPPLHPKGLEKIVRDFGLYPEDFDEQAFNAYVEFLRLDEVNKITKGIFAPWICYKSDILEIGLHDEILHSYHEDSDIFNRMLLHEMECIQSRDAFVYHLTCRGGQFQDGVESITQDQEFHKMKNRSMKEYLRKWGSWIKNDEYQHPILFPKYDIAYKVINCDEKTLDILEPWCSNISSDASYAKYLEEEQKNTSFNMLKRLLRWNSAIYNDIIVEFDVSKLTQESFILLQQLPQIILESGEIGKFELDIFKVMIRKLDRHENKLINVNDEYYTNQLL